MTTLQDIVGSQVKAAIFRILFDTRRPEVHLRELTRRSALSLGTVQQELKHLTRSGMVSARRDGNRVYYQANAIHPAFPDLANLVLKTDGLLGVLKEALQDKEILLAFVFGSIASGESTAESDVDLMIVSKLGLRQITRLLEEPRQRLGREINPLVFASKTFAERLKAGDHFLKSVLAAPKIFVKGTERDLAAMDQ
jgi:uncharacterized protein